MSLSSPTNAIMRVKPKTTKHWNANAFRTIHDIPTELLDLTLEWLIGDVPALTACTLVCRLWRDVAQPHLLSRLRISQNDSFTNLPERIAQTPGVADCVRTLMLRYNHGTLVYDGWGRSANYPRVDLDFFNIVLPSFRRLQALSLDQFLVDLPPPNDPLITALTPIRLQRLILRPHMCPVLDIITLLSRFVVDRVDIGSCMYTSAPFDPKTLPRRLHIKHFSLSHSNVPNSILLDAFGGSLDPRTLRSVVMPKTEFGPAGAFIRDCGRNLTQLDLDLRLGPYLEPSHVDSGSPFSLFVLRPFVLTRATTDYWAKTLNLQNCANLESLAIAIALPEDRTEEPNNLGAACAALLSTIPPAHFRELTLRIRDVRGATQIRSTKVLGLRTLDGALADDFPALRQVVVQLVYETQRGTAPYALECELAVVKAMPRIRAAGALQIVSWSPVSNTQWNWSGLKGYY